MDGNHGAAGEPIRFSGSEIEARSRGADFAADLGLSLGTDLVSDDISTDNFMMLKVGLFDVAFGSTRAKLRAAFQRFRENPNRRLVLFFHGGLVPAERGLEGASKLLKPYSDPEAGSAYPFFTIWQTGIFDVIDARWQQILQTDLFKTFARFIAQRLSIPLPEDPGADLAAEPNAPPPELTAPHPVSIAAPVWTAEEQRAFAASVDQHPVVARAAALLRADGTGVGAMSLDTVEDVRHVDPAVAAEITTSAFEADFGGITLGIKLVTVIGRIVKRYAQGRAHPGLCTVTEELAREYYLGPIGKDVWDTMKSFVEASLGDKPDAGGTALVDEIAALFTEHPDLKLTFAGHSAGAIFVTRLLEELAARRLPASARADVVFFAAAITAKRFAQSIPAIAKLVRGFRSFQLAEPFEASDSILTLGKEGTAKPWFTVFYPSSLPYAIAGILEDPDGDTPLVGMTRYFTQDVYKGAEFATSIGAVDRFQRRFTNARIESRADASGQPPGERSQATTHGGMPAEAVTRASTQFIFAKGLP